MVLPPRIGELFWEAGYVLGRDTTESWMERAAGSDVSRPDMHGRRHGGGDLRSRRDTYHAERGSSGLRIVCVLLVSLVLAALVIAIVECFNASEPSHVGGFQGFHPSCDRYQSAARSEYLATIGGAESKSTDTPTLPPRGTQYLAAASLMLTWRTNKPGNPSPQGLLTAVRLSSLPIPCTATGDSFATVRQGHDRMAHTVPGTCTSKRVAFPPKTLQPPIQLIRQGVTVNIFFFFLAAANFFSSLSLPSPSPSLDKNPFSFSSPCDVLTSFFLFVFLLHSFPTL